MYIEGNDEKWMRQCCLYLSLCPTSRHRSHHRSVMDIKLVSTYFTCIQIACLFKRKVVLRIVCFCVEIYDLCSLNEIAMNGSTVTKKRKPPFCFIKINGNRYKWNWKLCHSSMQRSWKPFKSISIWFSFIYKTSLIYTPAQFWHILIYNSSIGIARKL